MEKVKTFADIERHLKVGCEVTVKWVTWSGRYTVVTPQRHESGEWMLRTWYKSLHVLNSKPYTVAHVSEDEWESKIKDGLWIVEVKHPPREERFKVGDEVEVIETGEVVHINDVSAEGCYKCEDDICRRNVHSHHQLRYPIKEEDATVSMDLWPIVLKLEARDVSKTQALQEIERLKEYINNL